MVLLAHELGLDYAALKTISKVLGIPALDLKTYQRHDKRVTVAEIERGLESLHRTREQVRQAYRDVDPDVAELLREDAVINISVSFDGTWQKRGFTSHYGIGVCIDILTGLVIDYEILSSYCHAYALKGNAKQEQKITEEEYDSWRQTHIDCARNFAGSSKAMEQESAKRMWARSVNRHQVRYTEMLSDGDSAAFREVVALNPYPGHEVVKLECLNHAHKRMGTALRKLSSQGKLGGKGVGKLTANKCKTLQNYYMGAVLNNQGSIDQMKAEIWAGLLHGMSTDDSPLHTRCNPSWCW
ncbi:Protein translocase subunit SecD [Dissostichus eleginoides]|uniref:Protein translocase subunit SecD n=1 Tax=Dissostichus eleginoides TaxID=100907 RepID=A0AAD9B4T3_DISEL|nr:Protein translocase subunit SecD [Dissostichus eleginoides]